MYVENAYNFTGISSIPLYVLVVSHNDDVLCTLKLVVCHLLLCHILLQVLFCKCFKWNMLHIVVLHCLDDSHCPENLETLRMYV